MVFTGGPNSGLPKGLRLVCEERFGEDFVKGQFHFAQYICIWFGFLASSACALCPVDEWHHTLYTIFLGKRQDDLVAALAKEPDFKSAKPKLQEVMEARGCKVLFGVKFHPELMMIESCYRYGISMAQAINFISM